jgi:hypothetical protein
MESVAYCHFFVCQFHSYARGEGLENVYFAVDDKTDYEGYEVGVLLKRS